MNKLLSAAGLFMGDFNTYAVTKSRMNHNAGLPPFTSNPGGENTGEGEKNKQERHIKH